MAAEPHSPAWGTPASSSPASRRGLEELAVAEDYQAWLARTRTPTRPLSYPAGMPGVRVGQ